jgi:multimeric flavodoxin WrbA
MKALFLNCTLKYAPHTSNTDALINKIVKLYHDQKVKTEVVRVLDYSIRYGVSSDEGKGDEWPKVLKKIKECDILLIASPIWFGVRSSVAQLVMERLDGTYAEGDKKNGQYPLYGKVGAVVITGNEDGAHDVAANTLFNLTHLGCTIAPNSDCYWVGDAGPGPSYIEAGGDKHLYTNRTARYLVHNTVYMAKLLKERPIPTNLRVLDDEAKNASNPCKESPCHNG